MKHQLLTLENKALFTQEIPPTLTTIQSLCATNLEVGFFWGSGQVLLPSYPLLEEMNNAEKTLFVQINSSEFKQGFEDGFVRF